MLKPTEALTIPEVCAETRIGRTKIYDAINERLLVARKVGRKTLVLRDDLRQFLNALPSATELDGRRAGMPRQKAKRTKLARAAEGQGRQ